MDDKKLDDLPGSEDKYWQHAKVNKHELKPVKCNHAFIRKSGTQIECARCHAGFMAYGPMPEVLELSIGS